MKRFLVKLLIAAAVVEAANLLLLAARFAVMRKDVEETFSVPEGVQVVGVGNSHVGCTLSEADEFRLKTIWDTGMSFPFHYIRFRELERRGVFDRVKVCVMDCDTPALDYFCKADAWQNAKWTLPFSWRYLDVVPISRASLVANLLSDVHFGMRFQLASDVPPDSKPWPTWTPDRKEIAMRGLYGRNWRTPFDWDSDCYLPDWRERFFGLVKDLQARCARHGVRLVFIMTPLASDDPGRTNPLIWNRISDMAERLREMGCECHDYRTACPDDKFRDSGHLLRSSAHEFTRRFYADVLKLPVGEKPARADSRL